MAYVNFTQLFGLTSSVLHGVPCRYRYVEHLSVPCVCGEPCVVTSPTVGSGRQEKPTLAR